MADRRLEVGSIEDVLSKETLARRNEFFANYCAGEPFPHIVIDNFLVPELAEALADNFPTMEGMATIFKEPMSYKGQLSDINGKYPVYSPVFRILQSTQFRSFMTGVTGIENLRDDPILAGGGIHQSPRSGFLDIHVDANFHPNNKLLHRRINLLIYLNREWRAEWGGQFEIWKDAGLKPGSLKHQIEPVFNRAAIFGTTRTSWHGVSPIKCPDGQSRKSLALYYYTETRPGSELYRDSSVIWMNRSIWWKKALYPAMNFGIAVLKPYARHLRKILGRDKLFDADRTPD